MVLHGIANGVIVLTRLFPVDLTGNMIYLGGKKDSTEILHNASLFSAESIRWQRASVYGCEKESDKINR